MAGGVFGELCEAAAMVELEKWGEKEEMDGDLLTGWVLPGAGSSDSCSSPFEGSPFENIQKHWWNI